MKVKDFEGVFIAVKVEANSLAGFGRSHKFTEIRAITKTNREGIVIYRCTFDKNLRGTEKILCNTDLGGYLIIRTSGLDGTCIPIEEITELSFRAYDKK